MNILMTRTSNVGAFLTSFRRAQEAGLVAGANVIRNSVRRELRGGYQSSLGNHGDFVTGNSLAHVTISNPEWNGDQGSVLIGTDLLYNLFWEVGHHNIYTKHFERDEKWGPAFQASKQDARDAFDRIFVRFYGVKFGGGG